MARKRKFKVFIKGADEPQIVHAISRDAAKDEVIPELRRMDSSLTYHKARSLIKSIRLDENEKLPPGPRPGGQYTDGVYYHPSGETSRAAAEGYHVKPSKRSVSMAPSAEEIERAKRMANNGSE